MACHQSWWQVIFMYTKHMLDFIYTFRYKIAYYASLLAALYVVSNWLPQSLTDTTNFIPSMGVFAVAIAFVILGIFFRTKDKLVR